MIHFKQHWHFPKWMYFKRTYNIVNVECAVRKTTKQHRKCIICEKEQKSNSLTGKAHNHWVDV